MLDGLSKTELDHYSPLPQEICEHLEQYFRNHAPTPDQFPNIAEEILSGCAPLGVLGVDVHFPKSIVKSDPGPRRSNVGLRVYVGATGRFYFDLYYPASHAADRHRDVQTLTLSDAAALRFFECAAFHGTSSIAHLPDSKNDALQTAFHDLLTGQKSRRGFMAALDRALEGLRSGRPFAVHLFDIDNFKHVNDTMGHEVGDKLLIEVARMVAARLRHADVLGRIGGDEFCILQHDIGGDEEVAVVAAAINEAVSGIHRIDNFGMNVTVSIGSHIVRDPNISADKVLRQADMAMYDVKRSGKAGFRVFDETLGASLAKTFKVGHALKAPGFGQELYVVYQPIVDLVKGHVVAAEALVRWDLSHTFGIGTDLLIDQCRINGVLPILQTRVLEQVLSDMARIPACQTGQVPVSINVSLEEISDYRWQADLLSKLSLNNLPTSSLRLEITEQTGLLVSADASERVDDIIRQGIAISLDDFGSGLASFERLSAIRFSELKIDKSLSHSALSSKKTQKIIKGICALARELDLRTVAEGVETDSQCQTLRNMGCDLGQGFYFSRPLGIAAFRETLKDHINRVAV